MSSVSETPEGLLEQPILRIAPVVEGRRVVRNAAGLKVGTCVRCSAWWRGPRWNVHETGDEPLVFSWRRRGWLVSRVQVFDAEEETLGSFRRGLLLNRWGRPLLRQVLRVAGGHFEDETGVAAVWEEEATERRLEFRSGLGLDPLVRMLLLAAVLG